MAQPGFQTTFIPKRDDTQKRRTTSGGSAFMAVGIIILVCTVIAAVGLFLYTKSIEASIANKKESLERSQSKFEPGLIQLLADLDSRLINATDILETHVAPSKLFSILERATVQTVRFTNFTYSYDEQLNEVSLSLSGEGQSYASVALQSDEFEENALFRNPVFSGVDLNETTGLVSFNVSVSVDVAEIQYVDSLVPRAATPVPLQENQNVSSTEGGELVPVPLEGGDGTEVSQLDENIEVETSTSSEEEGTPDVSDNQLDSPQN